MDTRAYCKAHHVSVREYTHAKHIRALLYAHVDSTDSTEKEAIAEAVARAYARVVVKQDDIY